jgi:hypothetical protein
MRRLSKNYRGARVIGGSKAMFKGVGAINGIGDYKFMITAIDSDTDSFRIKIWTEDEFGVETIVYDNEPGEADYSDAATDLGGGSIFIHKAKKIINTFFIEFINL